MRHLSSPEANPVRLPSPQAVEPGWLLALIALSVVVITIGGVVL